MSTSETGAGPTSARRFVVLEHSWDGVHWDFMLEQPGGGSLRTWALDSRPEAGADQAARALPDHRVAYLDYVGEVSGGRGVVRRLDRGTFRALEWSDDRVVVELDGGQLVGPLTLWRTVAAAPVWAGGWVFRLGNLD
jgi:hypothetical protein